MFALIIKYAYLKLNNCANIKGSIRKLRYKDNAKKSHHYLKFLHFSLFNRKNLKNCLRKFDYYSYFKEMCN